MKSKLMTILGFLYVSYALITAHEALARIEANTSTSVLSGQAHKSELQQADPTSQPMDFVDEETYVTIRGEYRIVVWQKSDCYWCDKFEKQELPKLKKSGTRIQIKAYGKDKPEPGSKPVKLFPTVRIYRGKILVKEFIGYTKAEEILKHVKYRVILLR